MKIKVKSIDELEMFENMENLPGLTALSDKQSYWARQFRMRLAQDDPSYLEVMHMYEEAGDWFKLWREVHPKYDRNPTGRQCISKLRFRHKGHKRTRGIG